MDADVHVSLMNYKVNLYPIPVVLVPEEVILTQWSQVCEEVTSHVYLLDLVHLKYSI